MSRSISDAIKDAEKHLETLRSIQGFDPEAFEWKGPNDNSIWVSIRVFGYSGFDVELIEGEIYVWFYLNLDKDIRVYSHEAPTPVSVLLPKLRDGNPPLYQKLLQVLAEQP